MTDGNSRAYFVYYNDGYCDCGDHGLASFSTLEEAITFIEGRIGKSFPGEEPRSIDDYKLIRGHEVHIEPCEKTTAVRVRQPCSTPPFLGAEPPGMPTRVRLTGGPFDGESYPREGKTCPEARVKNLQFQFGSKDGAYGMAEYRRTGRVFPDGLSEFAYIPPESPKGDPDDPKPPTAEPQAESWHDRPPLL